MENLLRMVIRQRGFELEEPFKWTLNNKTNILKATENGLKIKIDYDDSIFKMCKDQQDSGLEIKCDDSTKDVYKSEQTTWEMAGPSYMNNLVLGSGTFEVIPFKPQVGQRYFYVDYKADGVDDVDEVKGCIMEKTQMHAYRVAGGNCFITRKQADENVPQMREMYAKIFKNVNDWSE